MIKTEIGEHGYGIHSMICSECGGNKIYTDQVTGEKICMSCGFVIKEQTVSLDRDKRIFDYFEDQDKYHHGEFITSNKTGHVKGSIINFNDITSMHGEERARAYRLRREQVKTSLHAGFDRNFTEAMNILESLTSHFRTPDYLKEEIAVIYRKVLKAGLVRGRSIEHLIAASFYAAHRIHGKPLSLNEVAKVRGLARKDVARSYRLIHTDLKDGQGKKVLRVKLDKVRSHISLILNKLESGNRYLGSERGRIEEYCLELLEVAVERKLTQGRNPAGFASAIIYIVMKMKMDLPVTQTQIALAAGITEVTLRNRYKGITEDMSEYVPLRPGA